MNTSKLADEAIKEFIEMTNIKLSHSRLCLLKDTIQHALIKSNELYPKWIKFSDEEPKKGEYVDVYSNARGRESDFEYEGEGVFYENNNDETREVKFSETETQYNITHWMRIPDCL
jgi:hypothetical protein